MTDFSRLEDPPYYRNRFRSPRTSRRQATRPSGLHEVLDSQRAERYQAVHPEPSSPPVAHPGAALDTFTSKGKGERGQRPRALPLSWRLRAIAYRFRGEIAMTLILAVIVASPFIERWFNAYPDGSLPRTVALVATGLLAGWLLRSASRRF